MKIDAGLTYYYEDFITVEEQGFLRGWALENEKFMIPNPTGLYRRRSPLNRLSDYPNVLKTIKNRLMDLEGLMDNENVMVADYEDMVSVHRNTASVLEHTDNNRVEGYYLRRYNIFVSLPEEGGLPIYDGKVIEVKERCVLKVDGGLIPHSTTPIVGEVPRILLSYGFNVK
jgi:hypothetical protein